MKTIFTSYPAFIVYGIFYDLLVYVIVKRMSGEETGEDY